MDGKPLGEKNPKWLQDDYVKFLRFAQWRIEKTGEGVVGYITNHGYLDNPTFRGMRRQLMQTFSEIYVLDLHGNSKKKEAAPDGGKDENVFDIQQGVAILLAVKVKRAGDEMQALARVRHADLWGRRRLRRPPTHRRQVPPAVGRKRGNDALAGVAAGFALLPLRAARRQVDRVRARLEYRPHDAGELGRHRDRAGQAGRGVHAQGGGGACRGPRSSGNVRRTRALPPFRPAIYGL